MSYILEALQESQKNRDGSKVPTLGSIPDGLELPADSSRGRYRRYLPVVAGLTLVVVGASWWLGRTDESGFSELSVHETSIPESGISEPSVPEPSVPEPSVLGSRTSESINDETITPLNSGEIELAGESSDIEAQVLSKSQSVSESLVERPLVELPVTELPVSEAAVTIDHVAEPGSERSAFVETPGVDNVSVEAMPQGGIDDAQTLKTPVSNTSGQGLAVVTVGVEPVTRVETQPLAVAVDSSRVVPDKLVASGKQIDAGKQIDPEKQIAQAKQAIDEGGGLTAVDAQQQSLDAPASIVTTKEALPVQEGLAVSPEHSERPVKHFRELPYDVQKSLPKISYSVHLYSPAPESRMVKMDGLMRREGDKLSDGLVLEEITSTGAVFSFRGHVFRVPVNG